MARRPAGRKTPRRCKAGGRRACSCRGRRGGGGGRRVGGWRGKLEEAKQTGCCHGGHMGGGQGLLSIALAATLAFKPSTHTQLPCLGLKGRYCPPPPSRGAKPAGCAAAGCSPARASSGRRAAPRLPSTVASSMAASRSGPEPRLAFMEGDVTTRRNRSSEVSDARTALPRCPREERLANGKAWGAPALVRPQAGRTPRAARLTPHGAARRRCQASTAGCHRSQLPPLPKALQPPSCLKCPQTACPRLVKAARSPAVWPAMRS